MRLPSDTAPPSRLMIVAAHPDDEVIGAATVLMRRSSTCRVVHVTDGAPRDMRDARAAGYSSREAYARARRAEALASLACCGVSESNSLVFELIDQEAVQALAPLARRLAALFHDTAPACVITHPYEGGHPDHDAVAFAVHAAAGLLHRETARGPDIVEMTSYHAGPYGIETGRFLPGDGPCTTLFLDPWQRRVKGRMMRCFGTQRHVLRQFGAAHERFRRAPAYDFLAPPHPGRLFYEQFDWGVSGQIWRGFAQSALRSLDLLPAPCP